VLARERRLEVALGDEAERLRWLGEALPIMRGMCGAMRGSCARMVASMFTIFSFSSESLRPVSLSILRLSMPA